MNSRGKAFPLSNTKKSRRFYPAPTASAVLLALGSFNCVAQAQVQGAWFAQGNSQQFQQHSQVARQHAARAAHQGPDTAQQQIAARAQLAQSLDNLNRTAHAIAAQQAAQNAARLAALQQASDVADGLAQGGLEVAAGDKALWQGASAPVANSKDGHHTVAIAQTEPKAILNWNRFDVGRHTTVEFQQKSSDAVLNRVVGDQITPSQIHGKIKGDGTVMVVNQNGVVFSGTSQVNVRNLVSAAANITDTQFINNGLYGKDEQATFTDARGKIQVQTGAQIRTHEPASVTQGGGYVLLVGGKVNNAGSITTPKGQTQLAAGDHFIIRKGLGTDANTASTTRGNEIAPQFETDSQGGKVSNSGLIVSREGDITLAGRNVQQNGVAVSITTVNQRGTVHLLNSMSDEGGQITLGQHAMTAILIDEDRNTTALDSQRDALIKESSEKDVLRSEGASGFFDNLSILGDRRDQSRIEIVSGGNIVFDGDSLTLATGGQIVANAAKRSFVADGAGLDVAGAVGVNVAMESNNVKVNVQGFELRDAPLNRDSGKLFNNDVWIDRRQLVLVPKGTNGYESDRWYTANGLLEVGGYLSNQGHSIGEWAAQGGTVLLGGSEVITQAGSKVNIAGGTLDVQTGYINQTWLKGKDGRIYNLNKAPADIVFSEVFKGYKSHHSRWNVSQTFFSPLIAPQKRKEQGYIVGRDAGQLIISAPTAVLEGDMVAAVFNGSQQSRKRDAIEDSYKQVQTAVARAGTLDLRGSYAPLANRWELSTANVAFDDVAPVTLDYTLATDVQAERSGTILIDSTTLNNWGLGGLSVGTTGTVKFEDTLVLQDGGRLDVHGARMIDIGADLVVRGGTVNLAATGSLFVSDTGYVSADLVLRDGATIDTRGLWTNLQLDPAGDPARLAWINGGKVSLSATGNLTLEAGSVIDTRAGGAYLANGKTRGGAGGDISLSNNLLTADMAASPNLPAGAGSGRLMLDGELRAAGFSKSGALSVDAAGAVVIGDESFQFGNQLAAGTVLPIDVTLAAELIVPAGVPIPIPSISIGTFMQVGAGPGPNTVVQIDVSGTVITANWLVSTGWVEYVDANGVSGTVGTGHTIPTGSRIVSGFLNLEGQGYAGRGEGQVVPAAFADGFVLPAPTSISVSAGSVLTEDFTVPVGTALKRGYRLPGEVVIQSIPHQRLDAALFDQSFSAYSINGSKALIVGDGVALAPTQSLLRFTNASREVASGDDPYVALIREVLPLYSEDPVAATLKQRSGVDLSFTAGHADENPAAGIRYGGWLQVGEDAKLEVDPGHTIRLAAGGQITVEGSLIAPGGSIEVINERVLGGTSATGAQDPGALSVWIGEHAMLDAAARAYTAIDTLGRRYGVVPDGGRIVLGHADDVQLEPGWYDSTEAAVIVRPGALVDASGTSAVWDMPNSLRSFTPTRIASNGGEIVLSSHNGLYLDGTLRAAAGGEGASGGRLSLRFEAPGFTYSKSASEIPERLLASRVLHINQSRIGSGLPTNLAPGQRDAALDAMQSRISADAIKAGGFDVVELQGRNGIVFDGDVRLSAGRSISLLHSGVILASAPGANVDLKAPHVLLNGATPFQTSTNTNYAIPANLSVANGPLGGTFRVQGNLVDVQNLVVLGFTKTELASSGDLRFLHHETAPSGGADATGLNVSGDLDLIAAQVYPSTRAKVTVLAGVGVGIDADDSSEAPIFAPGSQIRIMASGGGTPDLPFSVFGQITLLADNIMQGGVLRAPLGSITLGGLSSPTAETSNALARFLPGSITSVSAAGMVIPYGGTADGVSYKVDGGAAAAPNAINGANAAGAEGATRGIDVQGVQVIVDGGALLDLSGGGELRGAAFVTGRGGSVDALINPSHAGGQVYALVPGVNVAPPAGGAAGAWTGNLLGVGQQIVLPAGVPGLPAGTYTLLPANYALLPGAFRVELGAKKSAAVTPGAVATRDGSYVLSGYQAIANTSFRDALATSILVTPADVVRTWSGYNETSYTDFQLAQAATFGTPRSLLPADGKFLTVRLSGLASGSAPSGLSAFVFEGKADFKPAEVKEGQVGYDGVFAITVAERMRESSPGDYQDVYSRLVVTGAGSQTLRDDATVTVSAESLAAVGALRLFIGGRLVPGTLTNASSSVYFGDRSGTKNVVIESDVTLKAGQIGVYVPTLESGAVLSTLGRSASTPNTATGYLLPNTLQASDIIIGSNSSEQQIHIRDGATLYADGALRFLGAGTVNIDGTPHIAAREIGLAAATLNIGSAQGLAAAAAAGVLPEGLSLNQVVLDKLLAGDAPAGLPGAEKLTLSGTNSVNFFGSVDLDAGGNAALSELLLTTPALYGYGTASDVVNVNANTLVWNGLSYLTYKYGKATSHSYLPGAIVANGPGSGLGMLNIHANQIILGYPAQNAQPDSTVTFDRLVLGFSGTTLNASKRIVANNKQTLAVFQSGPNPADGYEAARYAGKGGALKLVTPLLTGQAGAVLSVRAGGALNVSAGDFVKADTRTVNALGAEIRLQAGQVDIDSAIALPSGRLLLDATGDIRLGGGAVLDLAGRAVQFFDVTKHTWGGSVTAESASGNILFAEGSRVDLSASHHDAGTLQLTATDAGAGQVSLLGTLFGEGGTGYAGGSIDVRAQRLGDSAGGLSADFAALNARLNEAGFTESRGFGIKQGNLVIGDELRAHEVNVSIDGGSLIVQGRIDASGVKPGTIRLAARDDLALAGTAVLDAHGTKLQVDSYGKPIEAKNRGNIELTSSQGWLRLGNGATLDVSAPDGIARGKVELNTGRTGETSGDARIDASGAVNVRGAGSIALNAFWRYSPTDEAGTIVQDNGGMTPVGADGSVGLDQIDRRSVAFIDAALTNGGLSARTVGLRAYGSAYHLRPGVEINSADTPSGNLTVKGDIDLSQYRYGTDADRNVVSAAYGAGEPLALNVRAAGDLTINGRISDGFAPQAARPGGYTGISDIPSSSGFSFIPAAVLGAPADLYAPSSSFYLLTDWTVPSDTFYTDFIREIVSADYSQVFRAGDTIPAGTQLDGNRTFFEVGIPLPQIATGKSEDVPAQAGTSPIVPMLASGTQSASIRLVSGADLDSADTRGLRPLNALSAYYKPGGTAYEGIITDVTNSGNAFFVSDIAKDWGDPSLTGTIYYGTSYYYLMQDWTIPNTYLYSYVVGKLYSVDGTSYSPGQTIPAGTQLYYPKFIVDEATSPASMLPAELASSKTVVAPVHGMGKLILDNPYRDAQANNRPGLSVIRTGTGSLELMAGGDLVLKSLYGVYTAGTNTSLPSGNAAYDSLGYYPDHGGDLLVVSQGDLKGYSFYDSYYSASVVKDWLRTQSGTGLASAWAINFGQYVDETGGRQLQGFNGFGTLGGGNLTLRVGGDAGQLISTTDSTTSQLTLAVASTGRVTAVTTDEAGRVSGGDIVLTGGGDLTIDIAGRLNPGGASQYYSENGAIAGNLIDLRGDISVNAGAVGGLQVTYGFLHAGDPRGIDPYAATGLERKWGGPMVIPGDGIVTVRTRRDLVLGSVGDAGLLINNAGRFSLWQPTTAVTLFSTGGNLDPIAASSHGVASATGDLYALLPPVFSAIAASGSIYASGGAVVLAPSPYSQLELLASDSFYAGTSEDELERITPLRFSVSGADWSLNAVPNPFNPLGGYFRNNYDVPTASPRENNEPIRVYAVNGDILNLLLGDWGSSDTGSYLGDMVPEVAGKRTAAMPTQVRAGRDIVGFGVEQNSHEVPGRSGSASFILNRDPVDVSLIEAGRDIFYANVLVGGPGTLEVTAGRNVYQGDVGSITSVGPIVEGDTRTGASIVVQAGAGTAGPDYAALKRYLDPANQADLASGNTLAGQVGKVAHTYEDELTEWLKQRHGYEAADAQDALAYFNAMAPEQQRVFLRTVYYTELRESGREYNDAGGTRYGSYLRGRQAIAALFPESDAQGKAITRSGNYVAFGKSGIQTQFGGDIQMLVPGGGITLGLQGEVPAVTSGLITQGDGNIQLYSEGSMLLGLSRIMTTFGGDILAWSAKGDINAGRGSKTTQVYTPPKRVYDAYGNVTLSPNVPSTGAGIATLAPIVEVPAGDVDLIAPLGTIDAGEAGIRVSGNVNIAALHVVNAENIEVQGESKGIPVVAAVNVGALTSASSAASSAATAAQETIARARSEARSSQPSQIQVQVLGFGSDGVSMTPASAPAKLSTQYDPSSPIQVVGLGQQFTAVSNRLTEKEKQLLKNSHP